MAESSPHLQSDSEASGVSGHLSHPCLPLSSAKLSDFELIVATVELVVGDDELDNVADSYSFVMISFG